VLGLLPLLLLLLLHVPLPLPLLHLLQGVAQLCQPAMQGARQQQQQLGLVLRRPADCARQQLKRAMAAAVMAAATAAAASVAAMSPVGLMMSTTSSQILNSHLTASCSSCPLLLLPGADCRRLVLLLLLARQTGQQSWTQVVSRTWRLQQVV
jgi:hypothetical protein